MSDCAISRSIVSIVYSVNNQFIYELHNGTKSTRSQQESTVFAAYTLSYNFVNQPAVGVRGFCRIIEPLKVLAFLQASYHRQPFTVSSTLLLNRSPWCGLSPPVSTGPIQSLELIAAVLDNVRVSTACLSSLP